MTYLYAWLIAWSATFGVDPGLFPGADDVPTFQTAPPPPPPPPTGDQARPKKSESAGQNDIYNGF